MSTKCHLHIYLLENVSYSQEDIAKTPKAAKVNCRRPQEVLNFRVDKITLKEIAKN